MQECTRLQSRALRFDMGVTSVPQPSSRTNTHTQSAPSPLNMSLLAEHHQQRWWVQECTRLQSKVLRFDMGVTSVPQPLAPDSRALLDELREENGQLRDDNDKLVEYLEKLEAKLNSGANTPAAAEPSSAPPPGAESVSFVRGLHGPTGMMDRPGAESVHGWCMG